ncbi:hypothetical protein KP509_23G025400 [Ceratopteris richardii]|uniref:Uncharacterized protein n=1 Tax=Ceratopteris richardii TaxID=49495 RepID=A0A8T2S0H1_CERRI|nr:hypothetical protein KP509_23G025400 [Ceratopteris richardii]
MRVTSEPCVSTVMNRTGTGLQRGAMDRTCNTCLPPHNWSQGIKLTGKMPVTGHFACQKQSVVHSRKNILRSRMNEGVHSSLSNNISHYRLNDGLRRHWRLE